MASSKLRLALFIICALVALAPFPYVVTRPTKPAPGCACIKSHNESASSHIRINYQIFKVASKTPSYVQIVQLFCKTGYFLSLNDTAKKNRIIGIVNQSSESTFFESQSLGTSIVRLRNVVSGRFLAINSRGRIITQAKVSDESIFKTMYEENYFHTFTSHKYFKNKRHDLFLGIKQNGRCKSPKLTFPGQISVQFILLPNNNTEDRVRIMTSAKQNRVKQGKRDMG
ncbi:hypothetical protein OS493_009606 [Desmophyllum pertusum]|uniref:Fibroblast growth factor n=1 Tax=Desmophyllum pertusum TaxID=174260 RepID=A0A9W9YQY6_9CNID|nr:hypothetical protein OS493_009606 [Desmophyllum pertusum]